MGPDCWVGFKVGVPCVTLRQRQDLQIMADSWAQNDPTVKKLLELAQLGPASSEPQGPPLEGAPASPRADAVAEKP